jgi:hypothetical protein
MTTAGAWQPSESKPHRSYTQTVKWIVATACVLAALTLGLFYGRYTPGSLSDGGCTVPDVSDPSEASVCFPAIDADPSDYFQTARETCAGQHVDDLARLLKTNPKASEVARTYSKWMRSWRKADKVDSGAVYAGCLKGFREE